MSKLKNCQCGCGKPHVIRHELLNTDYAYFNVACGECQITQTTDCPTEEAAITAWNARTASPQNNDELLWQEIHSLREKLKIAVEAIKSYDPEFDAQLFTHRLNSVDYDQLMEELSGETTASPRFTAAEREAMERLIDCGEFNKVRLLLNSTNYHNVEWEKTCASIATARRMLEDKEMAHKTKAECEKDFVQHLLSVGIKSYGETYDNGKTYYFYDLENGERQYWTNLSEESLNMLTASEIADKGKGK